MDMGSAHVIVTGGSSGIGLATARLLVGRGAKLSLIARGRERLEAAAKELSAAARVADVSDRAGLTRAIAELEKEQGQPCDILITSAGLARPGHFLELSDEVFREMIEVDYFGTLYALRLWSRSVFNRDATTR